MSRHHDVRIAGERGGSPADDRLRFGPRGELHRHGERVQPRRVGGDRRTDPEGAAHEGRAGDEGARQHGHRRGLLRRTESGCDPAGCRGELAKAANRLHRSVLPAPAGSGGADRAHLGSDGCFALRRQDPWRGDLELRGVGDRRDVRDLQRAAIPSAGRGPAHVQRPRSRHRAGIPRIHESVRGFQRLLQPASRRIAQWQAVLREGPAGRHAIRRQLEVSGSLLAPRVFRSGREVAHRCRRDRHFAGRTRTAVDLPPARGR